MRVGPGSFLDAGPWRALAPIEQHALRVREAAARITPGAVFSHFAAAAIWGIDILGAWPVLVDVSVPRTTDGRSSGVIRRRTRDLAPVEALPWGAHHLTTPAQTAVDLARVLTYPSAVAAVDQALWTRREGGALADAQELRSRLHRLRGPGATAARRAVDFARGQSDSVRESHSRVLIDLLGFPAPVLQQEFILDDGRRVYSDFFFREHGHVGEFDGLGKYIDPALRRGRTTHQIVLAEKDREDRIRRQVRAFSRWGVRELESPRLLWDILTAAGLPSTRPRPGR